MVPQPFAFWRGTKPIKHEEHLRNIHANSTSLTSFILDVSVTSAKRNSNHGDSNAAGSATCIILKILSYPVFGISPLPRENKLILETCHA